MSPRPPKPTPQFALSDRDIRALEYARPHFDGTPDPLDRYLTHPSPELPKRLRD